MRFWVAGATGFLGSHLVRVLTLQGHEVVAVSRGGGEVAGIRVSSVDVTDPAQVEQSARGSDGAFFAAGPVSRDPKDARELYRFHVEGTRQALVGLENAGIRRVVFASTSGTIAVSADGAKPKDETAAPPLDLISRWPYYRSKFYGEKEALLRNVPGRFEVVVVNPSLLLGPGDTRGSSTEDVRRFLAGDILAIPRGGVAFVDVRDAALGMTHAFTRGEPGERYLLSGANMTVSAFLAHLSRISGVALPKMRMPSSPGVAVIGNQALSWAIKKLGGVPPIDDISVDMAQHYWYCDAGKAARVLGFAPRDPGETLRDTVLDLRGEYEDG